MKTYTVYGYLTISVAKTIQAASKSAARKQAEDLQSPSLCHQCADAGSGKEGVWELNGFDDPPVDCIKDIILTR